MEKVDAWTVNEIFEDGSNDPDLPLRGSLMLVRFWYDAQISLAVRSRRRIASKTKHNIDPSYASRKFVDLERVVLELKLGSLPQGGASGPCLEN